MAFKTRLVFAVLEFLAASWVVAVPVATISDLAADVTWVRDGQSFPFSSLYQGFGVEDFDTVGTDAQGRADISLDPATGVAGALEVGPRSTIWLHLSPLRKEQTAVVSLLAGSLRVKIDRVSGKSGFQIRTDAVLLSVHGASFHIDSSPAGDILIATTEGRVECQSDGRSLFSEPGSVVEVIPADHVFHSIPVDSTTIDAFETTWYNQRLAAFQANAPRAFQVLARRYQMYFGQLSRAEDRIRTEAGSVLKLWKNQKASGTVSASSSLLKEKSDVIGPLLGARNSLFFLERINYRLQELRSSMIKGTLAGTEVSRGYTAADFFRQWDKDQNTLTAWMVDYRFFMKLFAERNNGSFPMDFTAQPEVVRESDFFN